MKIASLESVSCNLLRKIGENLCSSHYHWLPCLFKLFSRNCDEHYYNGSAVRLEETIPDYFSGVVLLRSSPNYPESFSGELRFQSLFNIIVIWMAIFIGLSKGIKSYGKVRCQDGWHTFPINPDLFSGGLHPEHLARHRLHSILHQDCGTDSISWFSPVVLRLELGGLHG